ncbi:TPA: hypothetical protein HA265_08295 [Candidatus Woesearchaeota archaeon]|nr:hypothetical protein [Candidatus Woesearchaeota archaeon]
MDVKKRGKSFIINSIFVILILTSLVFVLKSQMHSITGYQVLDATTAKTKLESALAQSSFAQMVTQGTLCVAVNDPQQPISFEAVKSGGSWTVTEEDDLFCKGLQSEDVVLLFSNYGDYSSMMDDPSPRNFAQGATVQTFQVLPSRYVELGGNVVCDATFKVKYCDALNQMADADQLIDADLVCCIDSLTRAQRNKLEEHLKEGQYSDEIGILQQPSSGMGTNIIFILIVIVVVVGGGVAGMKMFGKKKTSPTAAPRAAGMGAAMPQGYAAEMPGMQVPGMPGEQGGAAAGVRPAHAGVQAAGLASPEEMGRDPFQRQTGGSQELEEYAVETLQQGYSPEELLEHFIDQGWDMTTARTAINNAVTRINQGY